MKNKYLLRLINNYFFIIIIFLLYALLITGLPVTDILLGVDWSFPVTNSQVDEWLNQVSYTWYGVNFGSRNIGLSPLPFIYLEKFFTIFLSPALFLSSVVLISISLMGINIFLLLRFFHTQKISAFLSGICYMSSPLVFDYTIMGWIYIIFSLAFLPLAIIFFIRGVQEQAVEYIFLAAVIITITFQIHSIVWFAIITLALSIYLIQENNTSKLFKYFFQLIFFFALLNAYFLLNLLWLPDESIISSSIVESQVSMGASSNFSLNNIIRLFGATHNYQFEYIIEQSRILTFFSYFGAILILAGYFFTNKKILYLVFLLILIVPFFFYLLNFNRAILDYIPFANVFRDFGRFIVLSSLASAVLVGLSLDGLFKKNINFKIFGIIMISGYLASTFPWYTGELLNWKEGLGKYQVLRTKTFSEDYFKVEDFLSNNKVDSKVLYLPHSSYNDFLDDPKFHGKYQEAQDIFAYFSPMPGPIMFSDRNSGYGGLFSKNLQKSLNKDLVKLISLTNIKYIVIRKNLLFDKKNSVLSILDNEVRNNAMTVVYSGPDIIAYQVNEPRPHIYSSKNKIKVYESLSDIDFYVSNDAILNFSSSNYENLISSLSLTPPKINYRKINPTKYEIEVDGASGNFMLIFLDSFHDLWKVYIKPKKSEKSRFFDTWFFNEVSQNNHFIFNGYANSWLINSDNVCVNEKHCSYNQNGAYDYDLVIEFYPQKYYYLGLIISVGTFLYMFLYVLYIRRKKLLRLLSLS